MFLVGKAAKRSSYCGLGIGGPATKQAALHHLFRGSVDLLRIRHCYTQFNTLVMISAKVIGCMAIYNQPKTRIRGAEPILGQIIGQKGDTRM